MTNWDTLEAREAYLVKMGFSSTEIAEKGPDWVFMMTTQSDLA